METEAGGSWVEAIGDLHRERIDKGREREAERRVKKACIGQDTLGCLAVKSVEIIVLVVIYCFEYKVCR